MTKTVEITNGVTLTYHINGRYERWMNSLKREYDNMWEEDGEFMEYLTTNMDEKDVIQWFSKIVEY